MDCGATCVKMISHYYGRNIPIGEIRERAETNRLGSSLRNISEVCESIGLKTLGVKISYDKLKNDATFPLILHWSGNHYVVVTQIKGDKIYIADPAAHGIIKYSINEFLVKWIGGEADERTEEGIALLIEPTAKFYDEEDRSSRPTKRNELLSLFGYLRRYRQFIVQLILSLLVGSIIQLALPFLSQSLIDIGVRNTNMNFVYLILFAQLALFVGKISLEIIRSWILLHLSTRINISLVSDFFITLMNLPIKYFDSKMNGDILQRIQDQKRIESLLTTTSLNVLFSFFNLIVLSTVLAFYDFTIFSVFLFAGVLYIVWILIFLKRRRELDFKKFDQLSSEQGKIIELINGMQEIKLFNAERYKRWGWEYLRARLFKVEVQNLKLQQIQSLGSESINELKNIFISILAAKLVIEGEITLGMMLAITYIIGQLNSPIQQIVSFVYTLQDARIALERLNEINEIPPEVQEKNTTQIIPEFEKINCTEMSFRYPGSSVHTLEGLNLTIERNKTTAIVGASGSGKTTLLKLLLRFYEPSKGSVLLDSVDLSSVDIRRWREKCGTVMQEGFIFNDTVAKNIAVGEEVVNTERLIESAKIACIDQFINSMPQGYNTKIGVEGIGMSTGQKQRIMIARAVYKNPEIIFFDEATSALDATNERMIMENLNSFFLNRTAIIIAHRLSTVKHADQIVVLNAGAIIEKGTHNELIAMRGSYFNLVKNQLELEKIESNDNTDN